MLVVEQPEGAFLVTLNEAEYAFFASAVAAREVPGSDAAHALLLVLEPTFKTLVARRRRALIGEIEAKLPAASASTLQQLRRTVG